MAARNATIGALRVTLGLDRAEYTRGIAAAKAEAGGLGAALRGGLVTGAAVAGTALLALGAIGLRAARQTAKAMDDLSASADRLGVSAEKLQMFRHAAATMDVDLNKADGALEKLTERLGQLQTGAASEGLRKAFAAIGVPDDQLMRMRDASELIPAIAERVRGLGSTAEQAAFAKKLGIEELLPLLRLGKAGIADLEQEARDLGLVLDEGLVGNMAALNEEMRRSEERSKVAAQALSAAFAPVLNWMQEKLSIVAADMANFYGFLTGANIVRPTDYAKSLIDLQDAKAARAKMDSSQLRGRGAAGLPAAKAAADAKIAELEQRVERLRARNLEALKPKAPAGGVDLSTGGGRRGGGGAEEDPFRAINAFAALDLQTKQILFDRLEDGFKDFAKTRKEEAQAAGEAWGRAFEDWQQRGRQGMNAEVFWDQDLKRQQALADRLYDQTRDALAGGLEAGLHAFSQGDGLEFLGSMLRNAMLRNLAEAGADWLMGQQDGGGVGGFLAGAAKDLLGFAEGGGFNVGGAGGIDSQVVAFRATPGERVDVRRPGQDMGGGGVVVHVEASPYFDARVEQVSGPLAATAGRASTAQSLHLARRSAAAVQQQVQALGR